MKQKQKKQGEFDTQQHRNIDAKMVPKIHENRSKNGSGTDLGPLIIDFLAFWSDAKKTRFFDAFLEAQKSEKSDQGAAKGRLVVPGTSSENGFFGIWVPGAARARPESR